MECKVSELVKRGHDQAAELKSSCGAVDVREVAQLISDMATQLDVQLARSNALAAENAGLKSGILQASENMEAHHDDHGLFSYDADGEQMDALLRLCDAQDSIALLENAKTPATDAFLAEVRAENLQSYADSIAARMKDKSLSMRQKERLNFAWAEAKAYIAELHNAQLRKGVQS